MADTLIDVAKQLGVSSLHITFNSEEEAAAISRRHGYLPRTGIQVCLLCRSLGLIPRIAWLA